ncbi:MAG TPA: ankyrin repeat domain-containing protein, partial [Opitutales bacterium]|nr:ankyrin repeat domain-containing protein [Opitutales bacterium]
ELEDFLNALSKPHCCPAFHLAAKVGNADVIRILLDYGMDVNKNAQYSYMRALDVAAFEGHIAVVEVLAAHPQTHINQVINREGATTLLYAASQGHADVVLLLLNLGANPDLKNAEGKTALTIAQQCLAKTSGGWMTGFLDAKAMHYEAVVNVFKLWNQKELSNKPEPIDDGSD